MRATQFTVKDREFISQQVKNLHQRAPSEYPLSWLSPIITYIFEKGFDTGYEKGCDDSTEARGWFIDMKKAIEEGKYAIINPT